MPSILYLLPVPFAKNQNIDFLLPQGIKTILPKLDGLIVEDRQRGIQILEKIAGQFHIQLQKSLKIEALNEHSKSTDVQRIIQKIEPADSWALISDAGCPCIADPGSQLVLLAHKKGIKVIPLVGPCSILIALMASGLDGQHFTFHGYLSRDQRERKNQLKSLEKAKGTQIFMETPYRNEAMLKDALSILKPETLLSIARDITLPSEEIHTKSIAEWRKSYRDSSQPVPSIHKRLCIFLVNR